MCLILFAIDPSSHQPLIVAANRDEQHARATAAAETWQDAPEIVAGRDLVAGGTWLGVSKTGRFAAVTNFAETPPEPIPPRSRGELTSNFLKGKMSSETYLADVSLVAEQYRGFNLLISDGSGDVYYFSNRTPGPRKLEPGIYGLSNQLLDCNWAKVIAGKTQLEAAIHDEGSLPARLFEMLRDEGDDTPHSAKFILGERYGTSVSSVVIQTQQGFWFEERGFDPEGNELRSNVFEVTPPDPE